MHRHLLWFYLCHSCSLQPLDDGTSQATISQGHHLAFGFPAFAQATPSAWNSPLLPSLGVPPSICQCSHFLFCWCSGYYPKDSGSHHRLWAGEALSWYSAWGDVNIGLGSPKQMWGFKVTGVKMSEETVWRRRKYRLRWGERMFRASKKRQEVF